MALQGRQWAVRQQRGMLQSSLRLWATAVRWQAVRQASLGLAQQQQQQAKQGMQQLWQGTHGPE
jgi:hypothetical protein